MRLFRAFYPTFIFIILAAVGGLSLANDARAQVQVRVRVQNPVSGGQEFWVNDLVDQPGSASFFALTKRALDKSSHDYSDTSDGFIAAIDDYDLAKVSGEYKGWCFYVDGKQFVTQSRGESHCGRDSFDLGTPLGSGQICANDPVLSRSRPVCLTWFYGTYSGGSTQCIPPRSFSPCS